MAFDPITFVPGHTRVAAAMPTCSSAAASPATIAEPYEAAWRLTHCGKSISEAIDGLIGSLHIPYDLASSLVWAEMSSPSVRLPE